jgi:hypothetical protein
MTKSTAAVLAALLLAFAAGGPARAQGALGPGGGAPPVSDQQKTTAQNSVNQSQANAAVNFTLSGISSVIQQGLLGRSAPSGQRAALTILGGEACEPAACADDPWGWSVWLQGGGGQSVNSLTVGGYNLGNYGTQAGVQAQITPTLLVGVGASWQGTNGTLNGGFTSNSSIWGVTPYVGWQFDEHWNLSAMAGFNMGTSWLNNGSRIPYSSAYQSTQWTFQGGVNGSYTFGNVFVAPNVSVTYVPMTTFGYTDSVGSFVPSRATALTRGSAGGLLGMSLASGLQPYVRASVEHDFAMPAGSEANGDTGGTVGAGVTVPLTQSMWASLDAGYNSIGRTGLSLWSGSLRFNLRF